MTDPRKLKHVLVVSILLLTLIVAAPGLALAKSQAATLSLEANTQFYVPKPNHGAIEQIADLTSSGDKEDADLIRTMVETPRRSGSRKALPRAFSRM